MEQVRGNIARNIKRLRESNGLTQQQLATELNIRGSAVSNWEQGLNSPSIEIMFQLCDFFGIEITELYGIEEPVSSNLTHEERDLLKLFRNSNNKGKGMALGVLISNQSTNKIKAFKGKEESI